MWVSDSHHLAILGNPHENDHEKVSGLGLFLVIVDVNIPRQIKKASVAIVFLCSLLFGLLIAYPELNAIWP